MLISSKNDEASPKVVLVIDADSEFRAVLRDYLELKGLKILEASDPTDASLILMTQPDPLHAEYVPIDLVIVDPILGRAGGPQLIKMIKSGKFPHTTRAPIPVVLLSTLPKTPNELQAFIDAQLMKPVDLKKLSTLIREILNLDQLP